MRACGKEVQGQAVCKVAFALLGASMLGSAHAGASCGGFDLQNRGQASKCLSDSNSRNGCYNQYWPRPNSCWSSVSQSQCCGPHGTCSSSYSQYNSVCICSGGFTGSRCTNAPPTARPTAKRTSAPTVAVTDPCATKPCKNGGTCTTSHGHRKLFGTTAGAHGWTCKCSSGYFGIQCQTSKTNAPAPPPTKQPTVCGAACKCGKLGERYCSNSGTCGWCIDSSYNSGCVPGTSNGATQPIMSGNKRIANCQRGWKGPSNGCKRCRSYRDCDGGYGYCNRGCCS